MSAPLNRDLWDERAPAHAASADYGFDRFAADPAHLSDTVRFDLLVLRYPYVQTPDPLVFDEPGTYVETDHEFANTVSYSWNHGLGEIVTALLEAGLELTQLVEHDSVPWEALRGHMVQGELGEWRLREQPERLPHSYTLQAVKRR